VAGVVGRQLLLSAARATSAASSRNRSSVGSVSPLRHAIAIPIVGSGREPAIDRTRNPQAAGAFEHDERDPGALGDRRHDPLLFGLGTRQRRPRRIAAHLAADLAPRARTVFLRPPHERFAAEILRTHRRASCQPMPPRKHADHRLAAEPQLVEPWIPERRPHETGVDLTGVELLRSIVNLASEVSFSGSPGLAHYVVSKAAIVGLTRVLAKELGQFQIRVNALAPGFIATSGSRGMLTGAQYDTAATPLGRVGEPRDVLGALAFLISDESAFVSGQTLLVNGGRVLG
jgi:hypothetical protein